MSTNLCTKPIFCNSFLYTVLVLLVSFEKCTIVLWCSLFRQFITWARPQCRQWKIVLSTSCAWSSLYKWYEYYLNVLVHKLSLSVDCCIFKCSPINFFLFVYFICFLRFSGVFGCCCCFCCCRFFFTLFISVHIELV